MSWRFLLDTNVLSEPTRPIPNSNVLEMLERHKHEIATATVVFHELFFGCKRLPESRKRGIIESYLNEVVRVQIPMLPYDANAAIWHATERARLSSIGKTPSFADGQIAAIAKVNDLILVTNNVSDFADFLDLQIANWYV
ncbi:type II toxin-antitoxin system VapC family toxin [Microcoleus sp. MOSTC5]|uniref:type II toxin-antitoxin system VapC family toxin n=1 Tax=Microcoleus sp. MOSTC5 TaxID=3055378 RepID=UPI002FD4C905